MEEKSMITLTNKNKLVITGVNKIHGFNSSIFDIDTILGDLHISGTNLAMEKLDKDSKDLYITGDINKIAYEEIKKPKENFFKKLIKWLKPKFQLSFLIIYLACFFA